MERTGWAEREVNLWHILMTHEHPRQRAPQGRISPDGVFLTRIVIDQVLQALEGEPWRDVVPVVRQAKDAVMLDLPVSHRERVEACRHRGQVSGIPCVPTQRQMVRETTTTEAERFSQPCVTR